MNAHRTTQHASPAPYSRIPYAPRPAVRRKSKRVGIGDEVQFEGRAAFVDDIDEVAGIETAYVIGRQGAWADWVPVSQLHRKHSAAKLPTLPASRQIASDVAPYDFEAARIGMAACFEAEAERKVRNREREFAKAAGWRGEAYWETLDWRELQQQQNAAAAE